MYCQLLRITMKTSPIITQYFFNVRFLYWYRLTATHAGVVAKDSVIINLNHEPGREIRKGEGQNSVEPTGFCAAVSNLHRYTAVHQLQLIKLHHFKLGRNRCVMISWDLIKTNLGNIQRYTSITVYQTAPFQTRKI